MIDEALVTAFPSEEMVHLISFAYALSTWMVLPNE